MTKNCITSWIAALLISLLCACGNTETNPDARDEKNPLIQQALKQIELEQFTEALQSLEKAIEKKPQLARAHIEAARIYHEIPENQDLLRAIYHYNRYLEKRPGTQKAELIDGWIKQAQLNYAAEILRANPNQFMAEVNRLKRENAALRRLVQQYQSDAPKATPTAPSAPALKAAAPTQPAPKPAKLAARTYTVQSGDTLSKIARTVYGDVTKWRIIYNANRSKMKSERDLKIGQALIIPRLGVDDKPRG